MSNDSRPPKAVARALWLLLTYVVLKVLLTAGWMLGGAYAAKDTWASVSPQVRGIAATTMMLFFGCFVGLYGLIIWKIWSGRNWARYVFAIVFLLSVVLEVHGKIAHAGEVGALAITNADVISTVLTVICIYAVRLLFTKQAGEWFRSAVALRK